MWGSLLVTAALAVQPSADNPRRIILDVDPGIDDAMAIFLALRSPELHIEAITVVAGNVVVDDGATNALALLELAGADDIPVAKGASGPLVRRLTTAEVIHGERGLGETTLPPPRGELDERHAVDAIIDIVTANPGEITLVPVGPLTNIALALLKEPKLVSMVPEIILMGGSTAGGNASPEAEANIHNDPEAAKIVFRSGIPITMVGLGATGQTRITRDHLPALRRGSTPIGTYVAELADFYLRFSERLGFEGTSLHDPLAVGLAIDKTLALEMRAMHIDVETKGELTSGETVANRNLYLETVQHVDGRDRLVDFPRVEPNTDVPIVIDHDRFLKMFLERLTTQ
jgi:inosine-uridine nucleoside N-ribohydrolase